MRLKSFFPAFFLLLLVFSPNFVRAQAVPSGYGKTFSVTAGAMGSVFQPDYKGGGVPGKSSKALFGPGAYVDLRFSRWLGVEAEGRWLRFNQYGNIHQDNYLLGYWLPVDQFRFAGFTPYVKVLAGYGKMNFEFNQAHGRFANLAYGGGLDYRRGESRFVLRPFDFEYQQWPNWLGTSLHPWGFSAGIGYRIWGR